MNPLKSERFLDPFLIGFSLIIFFLIFYLSFHPNILSKVILFITNNNDISTIKITLIGGEVSFTLFLFSFLIGEILLTFADFLLILIFGGKTLYELINALQERKINTRFEKIYPYLDIILEINHLLETNDNWLISKSENSYRQSLFTVAFTLSLLVSFCFASFSSLNFEITSSIAYFLLGNCFFLFILLIIAFSWIPQLRNFISSKKGIYTILAIGLINSITYIPLLGKLTKIKLTLEPSLDSIITIATLFIPAILIILIFFKGIEYRAAANFYLYLAHLSYKKTKTE